MNFINNLKQTISFKLLSFSGYFISLFMIYSIYYWIPNEIEISGDPDFGAFGASVIIGLITYYYCIFAIIINLIGIIEYIIRKKRNKFKENKTNIFTYLFMLGLLGVIAIILRISYVIFILP